MGKFWAIFQNTFVQTIRQPIFGILILVTFAVLVMELPLAGWTMSSDSAVTDQKMLANLGLSTLLMFSGLLTAAFSASSVLAREIEDRTALTVISKPVSRAMFVIGKFAGVSAAVSLAFYLCALVFLMTVRHHVMPSASDPFDWPVITLGLSALGIAVLVGLVGNYLFGWQFSSTAIWSATALFTIAMGILLYVGKGWKIVPMGFDSIPSHDNPDAVQLITPQIITGIVLMYMASLIFCAVAVTCSTRLGQIITLLICLGVFMLGSAHPALVNLAKEMPALNVLTWVSPNLTYFYGLDSDKTVPLNVVGWFGLYCIVYVAAVLALGVALFQTRQLASQETSSTMPGAVGMLAWSGRFSAVLQFICGMFLLANMTLPKAPQQYLASAGLALVICGCANWVLWGYFSRGVRWSYWLILASAVLALIWTGVLFFVPQVRGHVGWRNDTQTGFIAGIAVVVLLILVLPNTRRHFEFHLQKTHH